MKVEFNLFGSDNDMAFELIPETDFERTFCKKACKHGAFTIREPMVHLLLMLETKLIVNPDLCDKKENI